MSAWSVAFWGGEVGILQQPGGSLPVLVTATYIGHQVAIPAKAENLRELARMFDRAADELQPRVRLEAPKPGDFGPCGNYGSPHCGWIGGQRCTRVGCTSAREFEPSAAELTAARLQTIERDVRRLADFFDRVPF